MNVPQIEKPVRQFLPADFTLTHWEALKPWFQVLLEQNISSVADLQTWLLNRGELDAFLEEEAGWRYIRMTCDTTNEAHRQAFQFFIEEIEPQVAPLGDKLNRKFHESPFKDQVNLPGATILKRSIAKDIETFREDNIPLLTEIQTRQQEYGAAVAAMTITWEGQELTLQQAAVKLQETDRSVREHVWLLIQNRRLVDKEKLDALYADLVAKRHQVAKNAGFDNYRDYMFRAMGRFDYSIQDCYTFHSSVRQEVVPLLDKLAQKRQKALGYESLNPWDLSVDEEGKAALKPFSNGAELLEKTIACLDKIGLNLGDYLRIMQQMGHLDLESRKGKAPGGYNYPLDEIGVPFIFMNATSTLRDLVTMVHEGGHAIHSFRTRTLPLGFFKHPPSEVAELASMAMELISMEHWDVFFPNPEELRRAKKQHLEQIVDTLPWVATIDRFQHWVYENPMASPLERDYAWQEIYTQFSAQTVEWRGLEKYRFNLWQKQLHLYEVPFYYIEYGMAQLGALSVWRNYKKNPQQGLNQYLAALELGYTAPIGEIYAKAGIEFNFSREYIAGLASFLMEELAKLD